MQTQPPHPPAKDSHSSPGLEAAGTPARYVEPASWNISMLHKEADVRHVFSNPGEMEERS